MVWIELLLHHFAAQVHRQARILAILLASIARPFDLLPRTFGKSVITKGIIAKPSVLIAESIDLFSKTFGKSVIPKGKIAKPDVLIAKSFDLFSKGLANSDTFRNDEPFPGFRYFKSFGNFFNCFDDEDGLFDLFEPRFGIAGMFFVKVDIEKPKKHQF